jgi:hypothetical protein
VENIMQAIKTRYHGPSNTRGSRIVAKCEAGSLTMPFDCSLNHQGNHAKAAQLLIKQLGWSGMFIGGEFDGDHYWTAKLEASPVATADAYALSGPAYAAIIQASREAA